MPGAETTTFPDCAPFFVLVLTATARPAAVRVSVTVPLPAVAVAVQATVPSPTFCTAIVFAALVTLGFSVPKSSDEGETHSRGAAGRTVNVTGTSVTSIAAVCGFGDGCVSV